LAAAIKDQFDVNVRLKKGHGGILKITMDDKIIYDNSSKCGQLPTKDEIIVAIEKMK